MDSISDANGILWLFAAIFGFYLLLVIVSLVMWCHHEKISTFAYVGSLILTVLQFFIILSNMCNGYTIFGSFEIILLLLGGVLTVISVFLKRRELTIGANTLLNMGTVMGTVAFYRILVVLN